MSQGLVAIVNHPDTIFCATGQSPSRARTGVSGNSERGGGRKEKKKKRKRSQVSICAVKKSVCMCVLCGVFFILRNNFLPVPAAQIRTGGSWLFLTTVVFGFPTR